MNKFHKQRLLVIVVIAIGVSLAASLLLYALRQNINVFLTPTQLLTTTLANKNLLRLGGMVKKGSVERGEDLTVTFVVTDLQKEVRIRYQGILPDLFREGTGVIAEGKLSADKVFVATRVLAKHDEKYMPKNVYQALRENTKT